MLKKIIKIENTGKLKNCIPVGDTEFKKNTVIYGTNGDGKSTFCSVLRSLSEDNPAYILGRKTLGQNNNPKIEIRCEGNNVKFDGTLWSGKTPAISIYDDTFIEQNIYAGNAVDVTQRRGLYRVIIGKAGVELALKEEQLTQSVKEKNADVIAKGNEIKANIPEGIILQDFLALEKRDNIDDEIEDQKKLLEGVQQASLVETQEGFKKINLPAIPNNISDILGKTLAEIEADAEKKITLHIEKHKMSKIGSTWLVEGSNYIADDECPYCAQDITGNEQVSAYRAIFSEEYKNLKTEILELRKVLNETFSTDMSSSIELTIEKNNTALEFWQKFARIDAENLAEPAGIRDTLELVRSTAISLLNRKLAAPLEPLVMSEEFIEVMDNYTNGKIASAVKNYNDNVDIANGVVTPIKAQAGNSDVVTETTKLKALKAVKKRHDIDIDLQCNAFVNLELDLAAEKIKKEASREDLKVYTDEIMPLFEKRINELLDDFNATFSIDKTSHSFAGGQVSTNYQICINGNNIGLGNVGTPIEEPSFKNTLSAGDKSTMALAFFLVGLENTPDKGDMVAVFDDPFTSQDRFRKLNTIFEIKRMGHELKQVIVLSHDENFLKDYWEKCDAGERKSLKFHNQGEEAGSVTMECDIEELCRARTETERQKLLAFYHENVGDPHDVVQKMRTVLETYFKSTYPINFQNQEWLGDICKKIREDGEAGSVWHLYDRVNRINDYTSGFHHGEDMRIIDRTINIDPQELKGFVKWTLKVLNVI